MSITSRIGEHTTSLDLGSVFMSRQRHFTAQRDDGLDPDSPQLVSSSNALDDAGFQTLCFATFSNSPSGQVLHHRLRAVCTIQRGRYQPSCSADSWWRQVRARVSKRHHYAAKSVPNRCLLHREPDPSILLEGASSVSPSTHMHLDLFVLKVYTNLSFMEPLISRMVDDDPAKRPTMDEVVTSFKEIVSKSSFLRLRARLVERKDGPIMNLLKSVHHVSCRTIPYVVTCRAALPSPKA